MTATLRRARPTMLMPSLAPPAPRPRRRKWLLGVLALLSIAASVAVGRWWFDGPVSASAAPPLRRVQVVRPERSAKADVVLPATVQPYQATDLHARVSGYVKSWKADLGDKVKAGDVLAEIDAPELDQEVQQAEAQLKQGEADLRQARAELDEARSELALAEANVIRSQANLDYATEQQKRIARLVADRAASREEYDGILRDREARRAELEATRSEVRRRKTALITREATIGSRESAVKNRAANLQRLRELQGFERIVAPFDGAVMRRRVEVGMLVQVGAAEPLYRLWRNDVLRVHVNVPQVYADAVRPGAIGQVIVPERPGRDFTASVTRTARGVDPISRTLLVELELPNADEQLLPGIYAQVRLSARRGDEGVLVPSSALLMRSEGPHVVAVGEGGVLRVVKVRLGRDLGSKVEVIEGIAGDERLVINPTDDVSDGQRVVVSE